MKKLEMAEMVGVTFVRIQSDDLSLIFHTLDGRVIRMSHQQECCEHVRLEDIVGDLDDLLRTPIIRAEERSSEGEEYCGTWTFYELATIHGSVTIRWYGESNGYYSESAELSEFELHDFCWA